MLCIHGTRTKWFDPFLGALTSLVVDSSDFPTASMIYTYEWNTNDDFKKALEEENRGLTNVQAVNIVLPWMVLEKDIDDFCKGFGTISPHISPLLDRVPAELHSRIPQAMCDILEKMRGGRDNGPIMMDMDGYDAS
jgi:hypothetical protein